MNSNNKQLLIGIMTAILLLLAIAFVRDRRDVVPAFQEGFDSTAGTTVLNVARNDTVEILDAVWRTSTASIRTYNKRATWLYLPNADSAALTASESVRAALSRNGIPASARIPAGDDTAVFRVRRWTVDTSGAHLIEMRSWFTTVLGSGPQRCRAGSGTIESYRAHRTSSGWSAQRAGPVTVGDNVCREIP